MIYLDGMTPSSYGDQWKVGDCGAVTQECSAPCDDVSVARVDWIYILFFELLYIAYSMSDLLKHVFLLI